MSDAAPRALYARDFRIAETRAEIRLYFGDGRPAPTAGDGLVIDTASQIILTPTAAKRLSLALRAGLDRHESQYGVIRLPDRANQPPARIRQDAGTPVAEPSSGADHLIELIDALGVSYGLEHSFKIFPGAILGDRVLLGFHHDDLKGDDTYATLFNVCRKLGMPDRFMAIYRERLPEANILLFGYEGTAQGGIYKAYLEFGGMFAAVAQGPPDKSVAFPLHLGFKWDAADNQKAALAHYTCYPNLPVEDMFYRIRKQFYGEKDAASFEIVRGIVERASREVNAEQFLYLEVEEEGNPRKSYDINMYRANLPLKELYPWLRESCRINGIAPETLHALYAPMKERFFGHISGGRDREDRPFLTYYFGLAGSSR